MKKRLLSAILTMVMMLTVAPIASAVENTDGWYDELVQSKAYKNYGTPPWDGAIYGDYAYSLLDIDQNGLPELILRAYNQDQLGTAWPWYTVFTYDAAQEQVVFVGDLYPYDDISYSAPEKAIAYSPTKPSVYGYGTQFDVLAQQELQSLFYLGCWSDGQGNDTYYRTDTLGSGEEEIISKSEYDHYLDELTEITFNAIAEYTPANNFATPSTWAIKEVEDARENGLIPEELDEKYQNNITRQEFCQLAVQLLETVIGRDMDEILAYHDVAINQNEFNDTKDQNVLAMNALRVVFGTEKGKFSPDSTIKRQDAATMLTRLAKVMNESLPDGAALSFSDGNAVSSYAYYSVMFVSNQQDNDGRMVMTGTGANLFSPHATYTREQAFLSFGRLYDVVKKCTIGQLRIEDEDVLGDIQISSADGYLTNRRVSAADNRRILLIPYDEYNKSGYYDEIIVSTPTRELKSDEYEIWLRPYMDGDICVRVDEGTIETVKPGMVLATVQSAVSCQVWEEFYIASAGNSSSQLLGTHIPITKIGKLDANFYTAGMYIENYQVEPIYRLDDNGNILDVEEFSVSMDVYNMTAIYGAIDVYDANMQYLSSARIDKFKLSEENLREVFWEACGLISDAVEGEFLTYRQNSASAHTSISQLKVPKGGYIVISNNCNESVGACIYNWTDFFVEGFSAVENSISLAASDWNKVSNSFADALLDTLEGKQESLIGEFLTEFTQKVNQNYEWSGYSEYVEEVMNTGIAAFMERNKTDIKELFKDCMIETAGDQVAGMTEEAFLNALGPAGQVLNFSFTAFDIMNYGIQIDHFRESPEAKSINIQYPNK